jgi:hypothetical protein
VTWEHFDPKSGFRLLLLYTAPSSLPIDNVNLSVVGMESTNQLDLTQRKTEIPEVPKSDMLFSVLAFIVGGTVLILAFFLSANVLGWVVDKTLSWVLGKPLDEKQFDEFVRQRVVPFFNRISRVFARIGLRRGLIIPAWLAFVCIATVIIVVYYQSTLLAFYRYAFPYSGPPLAIDVSVTTVDLPDEERKLLVCQR